MMLTYNNGLYAASVFLRTECGFGGQSERTQWK